VGQISDLPTEIPFCKPAEERSGVLRFFNISGVSGLANNLLYGGRALQKQRLQARREKPLHRNSSCCLTPFNPQKPSSILTRRAWAWYYFRASYYFKASIMAGTI
jgi:hypothetical protein